MELKRHTFRKRERLRLRNEIDALFSAGKTVTYLRRGAGWKRSEAGNALSAPAVRGNNREKEYLLKEGEAIPAFVDLGVFTADYRIKADKYDNFLAFAKQEPACRFRPEGNGICR